MDNIREAIVELYCEFCELEKSENEKESAYAKRAKETLIKIAVYLGIDI